MELKKQQKQGRDERTQEDYSAVYFCGWPVVSLCLSISALFLSFFQLHWSLSKIKFWETFSLVINTTMASLVGPVPLPLIWQSNESRLSFKHFRMQSEQVWTTKCYTCNLWLTHTLYMHITWSLEERNSTYSLHLQGWQLRWQQPNECDVWPFITANRYNTLCMYTLLFVCACVTKLMVCKPVHHSMTNYNRTIVTAGGKERVARMEVYLTNCLVMMPMKMNTN